MVLFSVLSLPLWQQTAVNLCKLHTNKASRKSWLFKNSWDTFSVGRSSWGRAELNRETQRIQRTEEGSRTGGVPWEMGEESEGIQGKRNKSMEGMRQKRRVEPQRRWSQLVKLVAAVLTESHTVTCCCWSVAAFFLSADWISHSRSWVGAFVYLLQHMVFYIYFNSVEELQLQPLSTEEKKEDLLINTNTNLLLKYLFELLIKEQFEIWGNLVADSLMRSFIPHICTVM